MTQSFTFLTKIHATSACLTSLMDVGYLHPPAGLPCRKEPGYPPVLNLTKIRQFIQEMKSVDLQM